MEKKLSAPKVTKYIQKEDGSKQNILLKKIFCKFCNKELNDKQIYEFNRGKTNGCCSRKCGNLYYHYKSVDNLPDYDINGYRLYNKKCKICKSNFKSVSKNQFFCSTKCSGKISSVRMKNFNPMKNEETRKKVSDTLKKILQKPVLQGGNGRGLTKHQKNLFDKISKLEKSFVCEYIFKTKEYNLNKEYPTHYKIDIASNKYKLAIEIDGNSHKNIKVKKCDQKKTNLLNLAGWKVLRFWNYQIEKELMNCVQTVMSMI